MTLKKIFKNLTVSYEFDLYDLEDKLFNGIITGINNNINPNDIYFSYFGNDDSGYKLLDEQWVKYFDQMHYVYLGNKTKKLYVESLNKFKMSNYIYNTFNYNIRNNGTFLKYTYKKFLLLSKAEVSLFIAKYGKSDFRYFEFRALIIKTLFKYFNYISIIESNILDTQISWNFNTQDIYNVISELENTDMDDFINFAKANKLVTDKPRRKEIYRKDKFVCHKGPATKEELLQFVTEDMPAWERDAIITKVYGITSRRTIRDILSKLGMTKNIGRKASDKNKNISKETVSSNDELSREDVNNTMKEIMRYFELKLNISREDMPYDLLTKYFISESN